MAEHVYFSDKAVRITESEARFGRKAIALSEIRAARIAPRPPEMTYACGVALDLFYGAAVMLLTRWLMPLPPGSIPGEVLRFLGLYATLAGVLILALWLSGFRFVVRVEGSFGRADVVRARHLRYARRVVAAINRARREGAHGTEGVYG